MADLALLVYIVLLMGAIKAGEPGAHPAGHPGGHHLHRYGRGRQYHYLRTLEGGNPHRQDPASAMDAAFKRAWTAILDANVCSIGTGIVLYIFGTGPIRGFAVALVLGVA